MAALSPNVPSGSGLAGHIKDCKVLMASLFHRICLIKLIKVQRLGKFIRVGLDRFEKDWPRKFTGMKVGLLVHPASVNRKLEHAVDLFIKHSCSVKTQNLIKKKLPHPPLLKGGREDFKLKSKKFELKVLFGPQHGIYGETQDNMIEWEGFCDIKTGLPVFSLYGHTRKPEPSMLKDIDVLVIDMQDVGSRYYTFIWTMELCMQVCSKMNKSVVILDRPNPISGHITEGPVLDMAYASFVGQRSLPVRHGMTIGEIGTYFYNEFYPTLDLHVIRMQGWRRKIWFDETGLPWVIPSPNMPTPETAIVYPGTCLLEGTNLSEGRGTTRPFEIFGAPFIEPDVLVNHLREFKLPGVVFRPMYFQPTFQKHAGKLCGGAQIHIINRERFKPFKTGVAIIKAIYDLYSEPSSPESFLGTKGHKKTSPSPTPPIKEGDTNSITSSDNKIIPSPLEGEGKGEGFAWKQPPYEYETEKMPIDILAGTDKLRKDIEKGEKLDRMEEWWQEQCSQFDKKYRKRYLIYK